MNRLVRVILTATINQFESSIRRAQGLFGSFVGAVSTGVVLASQALQGLQAGWSLLHGAMRTAINLAQLVGQTLLETAIAAERQRVVLTRLTGSQEQAGQMMDWLRGQATSLGLDYDRLVVSAQQIAVALRAQNGAIDTAQWQELTTQVAAFAALRPDVPIDLWGRAISAFMAGDPQTLTRLLDINVRQIGQLSDSARAFLQDSTDATEQRLGAVTRLGADAASTGGDAMSALREIAEAVGATQDLLNATADTTSGKLGQIEARWEEFKTKVGEVLLPIVNETLDKLIKFIDDHEEDIDKFIRNLGGLATEGWEDLQRIVEETDWEKIGRDLQTAGEDVVDVFERLLALIQQIKEEGMDFEIFPKLRDSPLAQFLENTFGEGGTIGSPGDFVQNQQSQGQPQWFQDFLGIFRGAKAADDATRGPAPDGGAGFRLDNRVAVDVTVTVDEDGQLQVQRIAQREGRRAANEAVGALARGITRNSEIGH